MKKQSVKKLLEKSKNVPEEKQQKRSIDKIALKKTNTLTIIAMNFVQEQLSNLIYREYEKSRSALN